MKYYFFILSLIALCSCKKDKSAVEVVHQLTSFSTVEMNSSFDVVLVEDSTFFVEIKGMASIVNEVEVLVEDGTLRVERKSKNDWLHPESNKVEVIIHSALLNEVVLNKACTVTTRTPITSDEFGIVMKGKANEANLELNCDVFYFWNNAPTGGKLTLRGQCNALRLWTTALVGVDAKNLTTTNCIVENGSKGDCIVNVTSSLEYKITDSGNIHLYGSPTQIDVLEHTGSGELIEF